MFLLHYCLNSVLLEDYDVDARSKIVLANSTITTVSENSHPDLYWALRGGSNNFGIVTSFTVRTFTQGPVFNSVATYGENQTEQVLDQVYNLFADDQLANDPDMGYELYDAYNVSSGDFTLSGTQRYQTPILSPPVFRAIDQITPLTRTTGIDTMSSLVSDPEPLGTIR